VGVANPAANLLKLHRYHVAAVSLA